MAKKFSIKRDPTFKATVDLPCPGQAPIGVEFTFKWMDRKALVKFNEDRYSFAKRFGELAAESNTTSADLAEFAIEFEFPQLKSIVADWVMDEEFNDDNLKAFVESSSELPAAVVRGYLKSYERAAEGN